MFAFVLYGGIVLIKAEGHDFDFEIPNRFIKVCFINVVFQNGGPYAVRCHAAHHNKLCFYYFHV